MALADHKIITVSDVAKLFHVSERTVKRWYKAGALPEPLPFGQGLRWTEASWNEYFSRYAMHQVEVREEREEVV